MGQPYACLSWARSCGHKPSSIRQLLSDLAADFDPEALAEGSPGAKRQVTSAKARQVVPAERAESLTPGTAPAAHEAKDGIGPRHCQKEVNRLMQFHKGTRPRLEQKPLSRAALRVAAGTLEQAIKTFKCAAQTNPTLERRIRN